MLTPLLSKGIGFPVPSRQAEPLEPRSAACTVLPESQDRHPSLGLKVILWRFSPFGPGEGGFVVGHWSNAAAEGWEGETETENLLLGFIA